MSGGLGGPLGAKPLVDHVRAHGNGAAMAGKARAADYRTESWQAMISEMLAEGLSFNAIARDLDARGETTVKGGRWAAKAVSRLAKRLDLAPAIASA